MQRTRTAPDDSIEKTGGSIDVTAVWLGTAGLYLSDGNSGVFIDPFVSRCRLIRVLLSLPLGSRGEEVDSWLRSSGGELAEAVLVGHSHYDHVLDAPHFARRAGCPMIGSRSAALVAEGAGLDRRMIRTVKAGDRLEIGDFSVTFRKGTHVKLFGKVPYPGPIASGIRPSSSARRYRVGEVFLIVLSHPAGVILHIGSPGYSPGMFDGMRIDVALMSIANLHNVYDYLAELADRTGVRTVIPIHWDNLFSPRVDGHSKLLVARFHSFHEAAARLGLTTRTLTIGEPTPLFDGRSGQANRASGEYPSS